MKTILKKIKRLIKQIKGFFPSQLPTGVTAFNTWADGLMETYNLPTSDRDSVHFACSTMIMRFGPTENVKSNYFFVKAIRAACAKQIAGNAFQEIKQRQKEAEKAAAEAAAASASEVANGPQQ
jgi:hypothetical protein